MRALSELFDSTVLILPCFTTAKSTGEVPLTGHNLSIAPLTPLLGSGWRRKVKFIFWLVRNAPVLLRELWRADAVHTPIPADVGTVGMLLAFTLRKPLFVRHCGNWFKPVTAAEHFWKWFMETFAGGRNVMLATGGAATAPSRSNRNVRWIFSTSLSEQELDRCAVYRNRPSGGRVRLVIACRQDREKGTGIVLNSLPLILKSHPLATLDVLGDGVALDDLKKLAAKLLVSDRVEFHGKVTHDRLLEVFSGADLFCYPTRASEGFPKVVLEALACGLPVITTRVSVLPELIKSGGGALLDEATPEALAGAVGEVLGDEEAYRQMSARAIETARQYSLERWRDTIGELLSSSWDRNLAVGSKAVETNA
jgi:glycosyltransferase involved in cell wall biosynthesis